jgi:hypothetical protein
VVGHCKTTYLSLAGATDGPEPTQHGCCSGRGGIGGGVGGAADTGVGGMTMTKGGTLTFRIRGAPGQGQSRGKGAKSVFDMV